MADEEKVENTVEAKTQVESHAKLTLFVRGLPYDATNEDLEQLFGEIGPVRKAFVVTERKEDEQQKEEEKKPVKNKGFGYVHYAMEEDAQTAITKLNNTKFKGRKLRVEFAKRKSETAAHEETKKKEEVPEQKKKPTPAQDTRFDVNARLIVRNLPWKYREADLKKLFSAHGNVHDVKLPRKWEGGPLRGFAFIQFEKVDEAKAAMDALNATQHHGRTIAVDWSLPKRMYEESESKQTETEQSVDKDVEMEEQDKDDENEGQSGEESDAEMEDDEDDDESDSDEESDEEVDQDEEMDAESEEEGEADTEDSENDEDESDEEEDDSSDEEGKTKTKKETKKPSKPKGPTPAEGRTLFIRNLLFESTEEDLKQLFQENWGPVVYAKITRDPETKLSRGTGFVCMKKKEDADKCLEAAQALRNLSQKDETNDAEAMKDLLSKREKKKKGLMFKSIITPESTSGDGAKFTLHGRVLDVTLAVDREQAKQIKDSNLSQKRKEDKRNLYLMREGVIFPGTPAAETLTPSELTKRQMSFSSRKKLVSNNPSLYISKTRLSIRNLPIKVDDKDLKALGISSVQKFKNEVKAGLREDLSKEEKQEGWQYLPRVKQAKIVRSKDRIDTTTNKLRSKGYGFLEFTTHAHALACLRYLNNNPDVFKGKRLIVEFSLENKDVVERRSKRSQGMTKDEPVIGKKRPREEEKGIAGKHKPKKAFKKRK
ncbi:hypothetical protein G6F70_002918 [Rhizopus microsporus]|uniref:RNA recognition motif-containing protein n=2 Tax=Rhizopus TaxID=4842 RepID=A0A367K3H9_RHIAZ|nr:hypothetical protein G6F71_002849 [Rhizopus microsporus]KAG1201718.1 hypothetical protein G6F70_002918 [Rhizopus microsporus]KAG1213733.1 hypothetical protein G6F69_002571 [Rhizopus microsporus]ORE15977.1 RNA-binding domain-containing protein [Rhizopus microsporus]RCH96737.1 RNA recognition motif-containing protein [Rhizopus azygosporus]